MKIKEIRFNYAPNHKTYGSFGEVEGEHWEYRCVGDSTVVNIEEHRPMSDGDKWFYDVFYENGMVERLFNIYATYMEPEDKDMVVCECGKKTPAHLSTFTYDGCWTCNSCMTEMKQSKGETN